MKRKFSRDHPIKRIGVAILLALSCVSLVAFISSLSTYLTQEPDTNIDTGPGIVTPAPEIDYNLLGQEPGGGFYVENEATLVFAEKPASMGLTGQMDKIAEVYSEIVTEDESGNTYLKTAKTANRGGSVYFDNTQNIEGDIYVLECDFAFETSVADAPYWQAKFTLANDGRNGSDVPDAYKASFLSAYMLDLGNGENYSLSTVHNNPTNDFKLTYGEFYNLRVIFYSEYGSYIIFVNDTIIEQGISNSYSANDCTTYNRAFAEMNNNLSEGTLSVDNVYVNALNYRI